MKSYPQPNPWAIRSSHRSALVPALTTTQLVSAIAGRCRHVGGTWLRTRGTGSHFRCNTSRAREASKCVEYEDLLLSLYIIMIINMILLWLCMILCMIVIVMSIQQTILNVMMISIVKTYEALWLSSPCDGHRLLPETKVKRLPTSLWEAGTGAGCKPLWLMLVDVG